MLHDAAQSHPVSQPWRPEDESLRECIACWADGLGFFNSSDTTKQPISCRLLQNICLPRSTVYVNPFKLLMESFDMSFP